MAFMHGVEIQEVTAGTRPIQVVRSSVIGIVGTAPDADASAFPLNTPVLVTKAADVAQLDPLEDGDGTLYAALQVIQAQAGDTPVIVVRVADSETPATEQSNVIGGVDAATGAYTGMQALLGAQSRLGLEPRLVCAPGFSGAVTRTDQTITGKPVADALVTVAGKLRAIAVVDGPDTTDADATTFAGLFDTPRAYIVDPWAKYFMAGAEIAVPGSAFAAGAIAASDAVRGWWSSPSNWPLVGCTGLGRPIDFKLGVATSRANLLNEEAVATIINQNGYRLWGNRVPAATATQFQFLAVRRTMDIVQESLLQAHLWAVDRGITKTYVEEVTEGVNAFLRDLRARGAIIQGSCWADPDLNTPSAIQNGQVYFDFDITPVYPAEHVTFRSRLSDEGLEEITG